MTADKRPATGRAGLQWRQATSAQRRAERPFGRTRALVGLAAVIGAAALGGCGSSSSTSSGASASTGATSAPRHTVATVPGAELAHSGQLTICSDFPNPPQEFYTANGAPQGSDVDTGDAIAARLGLKPVWSNTVFDTILEALSAGKCDLVISGVFITPEREKVVDFIPYIDSGEQLMVQQGNPAGITDNYTTLCGKAISAQLGDSENVTAQKWSAACKASGKPPITILDPSDESTALEELTTNHVVAHFNDAPVVQYYAHKSPSQFQLITPSLLPVQEGIAVAQGKPALLAAVRTALKSIESDGTYKAILAKWGLQSSRVPSIG